MHVIAPASSAASYEGWACLAVFALMALPFAGIPAGMQAQFPSHPAPPQGRRSPLEG
jgi:hypothetical protein